LAIRKPTVQSSRHRTRLRTRNLDELQIWQYMISAQHVQNQIASLEEIAKNLAVCLNMFYETNPRKIIIHRFLFSITHHPFATPVGIFETCKVDGLMACELK